jgi:hypothetical protein
MMRTVIVTLILVAGTLALGVAPAQAYYDDIHYALTYYIARMIGCTPEQSYRLASANVSVDWSPPTEPVQGVWPTTTTQEPRAKFHAFRDETRFPESIGDGKNGPEAERAIRDQSVKLLAAGIEGKNPGVFLHFFQDREPHALYGTRAGHWVDTLDTLIFNPAMGWPPASPMNLNVLFQHFPGGMGGTTDWLSFQHGKNPQDPDANARLVRQTAEILATAMRKIYRVNEGRPCLRPLPDASQYLPVLAELRARNPYPKPLFPKDLQYVKRLKDLREKKEGKTPQEQEEERQLMQTYYAKHLLGPDIEAARQVIVAAMRRAGMTEAELPAKHRQYPLDDNGNLGKTNHHPIPQVGMLSYVSADSWTLVGTLRVKVQGATGAGGQVTVKAPRTQTSETEYVMAQAAIPGPGGSVEFKNMPVGQLIVEVPAASLGGEQHHHPQTPPSVAPTAQRQAVVLDRELVEVVIGGQQHWRW